MWWCGCAIETLRPVTETGVLIIGAGFSGICLAARLTRAGMGDFLMLEKAQGVGGTWRDNVYPGCACDVPSRLYSLSFAQADAWTRRYPGQAEILDYLQGLVARFDLAGRLRFGAEMTAARFDAKAALWRVDCADGRQFAARVLVSAVGALHVPDLGDLPGLETFEGPVLHTARWDKAIDLAGKRVALIGSGASAVQVAPEMAPKVERLVVFQRTPAWVVPKLDPGPSRLNGALERRLPGLRRLKRALLWARMEVRGGAFRRNGALTRLAEKAARAHLQAQVADPELLKALTPNFRIGCKRVLISNDWYPTLQRPNVQLAAGAAVRATAKAVIDAAGEAHPVDAVVLATGFEVAKSMMRLPVFNAAGQSLGEAWAEGVRSFWGVSVSGFENVFLMLGPNTGLGHTSQLLMIEAQAGHVVSALRLMQRQGARRIEVDAGAEAEFQVRLRRDLKRSIWQTGGCTSWYQDASGANPTVWPGYTFSYSLGAARARRRDYRFRAD